MSITYDENEKDVFTQQELAPAVPNPLTDPISNLALASSLGLNTQGYSPLGVDTSIQNNSGTLSLTNGKLQSPNFATGTAGWSIDSDGNCEFGSGKFRGDITGATGTFSGTVTVASLNIPDTTTANSFHVDSNGNSWWGANVASGYTAANAYVLNTGQASFKNPLVGGATYQYTIVNSGIFTFGDGSDGAGVADGSTALAGASLAANVYTLTRDVYYTDLTVSTGVTIQPSGYRIFGQGTLTMNGTATISRNGISGSNGSTGRAGTPQTGGAGGGALADGYLKGSVAGATGGTGGPGTTGAGLDGGSAAGTATSNSIGSSGSNGGTGGNGGGGHVGGTGTGGTATASNVKLIANWHLATLLDIAASGSTVKFDNSAGAGGGGGGASGNGGGGINQSGGGGSGGGGASGGGIIAIYFRSITIGASASIIANGGVGGNGGNGQNNPSGVAPGGGGGAGGAGGNGGQIIIVYNSLTNNGSLTAAGGAGGTLGTGGTGTGNGTNGTAGTNGSAGNTRLFQVSL